MQPTDHSTSTGIRTDPYTTASIQDFLVRFNRKLESFIELLQLEQKILVSGTADEISHAAQSKLDRMHELSQFIANHFNQTSKHTNTNLEQALKMMDVICVEKQIKQWPESQELIRFCRALSDENSILLANRLKSTNNALDTLYSLTGSQQNKTYDNNGHSKHSHISRQLASV